MFLVVLAQACAVSLWVDHLQGDDLWEGSEARPLRTLAEALRQVEGVPGGSVIHTAGGVQYLDAPLSLTGKHHNVTITSAEGTVLNGGVQIPAGAFKPVSEGSPVLVADLSQYPHLALGGLTFSNGLGTCANTKAELYYNSQRMIVARYPNIGSDGYWQWMLVAKAVSSNDSQFVMADSDKAAVGKSIDEKGLALHGYWGNDWGDNYVAVESIDVNSGVITVSKDTPFVYPVQANARYMVLNSLAQLDHPGEYYIDYANRTLYFYPPEGLAPSDEIVLSNLTSVITMTDTSGHTLVNISAKYSSYINMVLSNVNDTVVSGGDLSCAADRTISLSGYRNTVVGNTLSQTGCFGMTLDGGDTTYLIRGENVITNNVISNFSNWKRTYVPGIHWSGVGNVVEGNLIENGPHSGILGGGNDNIFSNNHLRRLVYETLDTGAWYSGRSWIARNNTIEGNVFEDVYTAVPVHLGAPSVQAIYNDDQLSDNKMINNTFIRCHCGTFIGGGRRHTVQYNTYINVTVPMHIDNRGQTWQPDACTPPNGTLWEGMYAVNYTQPPYSVAYPELLNIDQPCVPVHNVVQDNRYCGTAEFADFTPQQQQAWGVVMANNTQFNGC